MKNKVFVFFAVLVLLFTVGYNTFAQSDQYQRFRGNWYATERYEIIHFLFINDSFILYYDGIPEEIGYFVVNTNEITFYTLGFYDGSGWEWEEEEWDWVCDYRFSSSDVLVIDDLIFYRF